jgi:hypothetical protein
MRFMMMIKSDERAEAGQLPSPELLMAMGKYNDELVKAGVLVGAEGLHPSMSGTRLKLAGGKRNRTDGPFAEAKEVIAGYWIIDVASKDEAIAWAKRVPFEADVEGYVSGARAEIEIRRLNELDDFPVNEDEVESGWREQEAAWRDARTLSPRNPALKRFFCMAMGDADYEAGKMPDEKILAAMGEYMGTQIEGGVLLSGEGLRRSTEGAKVYFQNGVRTVTDGPFLETKEIVGGFATIQAESLEAAIDMGWEFLEVGGPFEPGIERHCEIRQVFDMSDFPAELVAEASGALEAEAGI